MVAAVTTVSGIKSVLNLPAAWEGILSCCRKRYLKHGAGVHVAGADGSLVQVDDLPGQRKADAGFSSFRPQSRLVIPRRFSLSALS